ncbi:hypothetical protein F5Y19DRAFT_284661 [Xylariaceae sp. FL1651]|nr:hypothetical protein F5Y19DRAFT_284661 [Xylariaceae sp. FL1651]
MVESSTADTTAASCGHTETVSAPQGYDNAVSDLGVGQALQSGARPGGTSKPGPVQTLWILIFKGQPRDIQSTRVTELYIAYNEDESTNVTIQIQGEHPNFRVNEVWNQPLPRLRPNFYRRLAVSTLTTTGEEFDTRLRDAIWSTPVNNTELDWSCQSWVGDVVTVLQEMNLITAEEGDNALNGMVNYLSQAPWR